MVKNLSHKANAKLKQLVKKGKHRMEDLTNKTVMAYKKKQMQTFKKLAKLVEKQTRKFAKMRLKEAKDLAVNTRKSLMKKLKQAKAKIASPAKKKLTQAKLRIGQVGRKMEQGAKTGMGKVHNLKGTLEEQVKKLATMSQEAKHRFAAFLAKFIHLSTANAFRKTAKLKQLLAQVQEGESSNRRLYQADFPSINTYFLYRFYTFLKTNVYFCI